jgi:DNA-binding NarL/FixJ family response regulator
VQTRGADVGIITVRCGDDQRGTSAARRRRYRRRQRAGVIVLNIAVHEQQVAEALVASSRLAADQTADRAQLAKAVGEVISEWAAHWAPARPK